MLIKTARREAAMVSNSMFSYTFKFENILFESLSSKE